MTSLEDRMRANRQVLAELTEAERAARTALYQLEQQAHTADEALQTLREVTERVLTFAFLASLFGGFVAGVIVAAVVYWLL